MLRIGRGVVGPVPQPQVESESIAAFAKLYQSGGRYQPVLYQEWLRSQGLTAGQYEMQLRQSIAALQLERGLSESAFVTDADVAALIRLLKQERRVSYAIVNADAFLSKVAVDAKEIEDYYRAKASLFTHHHARAGVVDVDDEHGRRLVREAEVPVTTFSSRGADAHWRAEGVQVRAEGSAFSCRSAAPGGFSCKPRSMATS